MRADLAPLVGADPDSDPWVRTQLATDTALAVITQGRSPGAPELVDLADRVGLETLAELWRGEPPSSLPGALWALYLLRRWAQSSAEEVTRLWRAGRPYAPAAEVVAGVADRLDPGAVAELTDAILNGAYRGEFDVALERAAAFFRVVAAGRRETARPGADGDRERQLAQRNDETADGLSEAAAAWRKNPL